MVAKLELTASGFKLDGILSFISVANLREQGRLQFGAIKTQTIEIDFLKLLCVDNSILPLLTAWLKDAKQVQKTLRYVASKEMQRLISACGVDELLPLVEA
ncbi:MAG: hypothetical protein K0U12_07350 [Gammaproteobacteria bacterium]|nr:hypothetical protein [Gammaproteobacteria bacterium]